MKPVREAGGRVGEEVGREVDGARADEEEGRKRRGKEEPRERA